MWPAQFSTDVRYHMKPMRLVLACLFLFTHAALASGEWEKRVQTYIDLYEKSAAAPMPIVYPQLAERVRLQFPEGKAVHISWSSREGDGKVEDGELYLRSGELFVIQNGEGWNLVTRGDYVYEWRADKTEGIRIAKNEAELVDYALYLTDPALLMTGMYYEYLSNPNAFTREGPDDEGVFILRVKKPVEGFESVTLTEHPIWFRGLSVKDPSGVLRFSSPEIIPSIPDFLLDQLKGIRFEDSNLSLRRHLNYL